MLPHLGAGAGQCIEDAYLLVNLLSHPETVPGNVQASPSALSALPSSLRRLCGRTFCAFTMSSDVREHRRSGRKAPRKARSMKVTEEVGPLQKAFAMILKAPGIGYGTIQ